MFNASKRKKVLEKKIVNNKNNNNKSTNSPDTSSSEGEDNIFDYAQKMGKTFMVVEIKKKTTL